MRYADAGDVRIAYDDQGPRVDGGMVFPPWWCNSGRSFFARIAGAPGRQEIRVIRLDWRGHGNSSRTNADFGHGELADDAMAVIEAAAFHPVRPVAQAHGGWPAHPVVAAASATGWPRSSGRAGSLSFDPPPPFMAVFHTSTT